MTSSDTMRFAKNFIFFAARDGMAKCLCAALLDCTTSEVSGLLEQEVHNYQGECVTPLIVAARNGHVEVVKVLVSEFNADTEHAGCVKVENYYIQGATALWCAAGAGHLNVVKVLVHAGANVNHTTLTNSTPLRAACFDGRLDIVKYLIEHGALVNIPNKYNNSCLMIASYKGHLDIVQFLLDQGVDPNNQANCGATALLFASECGHLQVVKELLKYGARLITTVSGMTPVLAAAERTRADVVEYLLMKCELTLEQQIDALELLGASFANDKDNYNLTRTFHYLQKAMLLRYSQDVPISKPTFDPIPAYENWIECQTLEELYTIRLNENALHMESLTIRERILGIHNPDVPHPVIFRGAVFADNGRFDRCLDLWLHGLKLYQLNDLPIVKDLLRFAQIFSQMLRVGIEIDLNTVELILKAAVKELERNKARMTTIKLDEDIQQEKEDFENNVISTLYILVIISKLLETSGAEQLLRIHRTVYELNKLKVSTRNGQSLLHLAVNPDTPVDNFHTNDVCRFPCASTTKLLIKCGADVNALDNERNSPLHIIAGYQKPIRNFLTLHSIITLLIEAGAHVDIVNNRGEIPTDTATTGITEIILRTQSKPSLKCLAARAINRHQLRYRSQVPEALVSFIELHGPSAAVNTQCA
ncbi:protein fem-1 homolog B isoform X2 [Rhodnius prolixus]|uniref:protein fem-1 homolog B isoform X2 n=1 Tax=Rhodnius prolixus TaxID=13249 RepID=UPI003D18A451